MSIKEYVQHHKKLVTYCALAIVIIVPAGMYIRGRSGEVKFLTAAVNRGNITSVVQATGTINPLTTVPVGSFVSGTVQYIFADFNSRVHAGQVLAQLDPTIYEAQVLSARGSLDNAKANLQNLLASVHASDATIQVDQANVNKAKADLAYAQANAKRTQTLAAQGVLSVDQSDLTTSTLGQAVAAVQAAEAQVTQAQAQLEQVNAQVLQARAQVETAQGNLKQSETNLQYTTILSPIDGIVVLRSVDVGQSVAASLSAPNVFTVAQDLKRMQLFAKTDESDTGNIHVGTEVTFQVDAFPGEIFRGRVSAVRLNAYTVQNVVTYDTVIDFENPQEKLLPGETAYVTIPTGHAQGVLRIPNAALTYTPDMPNADIRKLYDQYKIQPAAYTNHLGGWQVVWKLGPDGKQQIPMAVKAGITDYLFTQTLDGDLKEGDVLITAVQNPGQARPGQQNAPGFGNPGRGGGRGGR